MRSRHVENHFAERIGWLRAAVLGANDGIISTASLVLGVAAGGGNASAVLTAGVAGLVAGAMSMAAGEYVSVSSQADSERADIARETLEIKNNEPHEREELTQIYEGRGLERELAEQVATALMKHDAIGAHARDELGLSHITAAKPSQAAAASAASFSIGAALPLLLVLMSPAQQLIAITGGGSLLLLALLGAVSAKAGGAKLGPALWRVTFWGAAAMGLTTLVGKLFGAVV